MENNNAKHFALQLGVLISLYISIGALIHLLFGIITIKFPDELGGYWEIESASSSMRFSIALLLVFFPTYIALTRVINVARRGGALYLSFTKWLIYLSLLIGGVVILGDLVSVIYSFLNGELTVRFFLKALTVLVVVGAAFSYYLYDARGYWQDHEKQSKQFGMAAALLVIVAVIFGYLNMENPKMVRERQADQVQIADLGNLQSQVMSYYATRNTLPESLDDLEMRGYLPSAPEGRDAYTYRKISDTSFELCAEFAHPSREDEYSYAPYYDVKGMMLRNPDDWTHKAGNTCFTRVVNPITTETPVVNN